MKQYVLMSGLYTCICNAHVAFSRQKYIGWWAVKQNVTTYGMKYPGPMKNW